MKKYLMASMFCLMIVGSASAQEAKVTEVAPTGGEANYNYANRKAYILDVCPYVKMTKFNYAYFSTARSDGYRFDYGWTNSGQQPVIAFEHVTLKYDVFDQPLRGTFSIVPGHNSADYSPLQPNESDGDGTLPGYSGNDNIYTAITYVRSVRLADNTVWRVDENELRAALKKVVPGIRNLGSLAPEPKEDKKPEKPKG